MQRVAAVLRPCNARTVMQARRHMSSQDIPGEAPSTLTDHAHKLDHQEDLGYDPDKPATEQEKELQSGAGMADMDGTNLYAREALRYQLKAQEEATKSPPSTGFDEERTGDLDRVHQQAREAAAMVGRSDTPEDASLKDTGT